MKVITPPVKLIILTAVQDATKYLELSVQFDMISLGFVIKTDQRIPTATKWCLSAQAEAYGSNLACIVMYTLVYQARPFSHYTESGWGESMARKGSSTGHCLSKINY